MTDLSQTPALPADPPRRSQTQLVLRRLILKPGAIFSLIVLGVFLLFALIPDLFAPHDPYAQALARRLKPPAWADKGIEGYWLGTDQLGRDIWSRIIHGARITLIVSASAVMIAAVLGIAAGLAAGFLGGRTDAVVLRLIDMQLAFPVVLLVIAIVAVVGSSVINLILLMGIAAWPRFARIVRGAVLSVRTLEYVDAARSIGGSRLRVITNHILPNILSAIIVYASFELARMILLEATLSFLGLGIQPPSPTWGGMINDGRGYLSLSWSVSLFPGIAIALLILAFNLLGDELRDALDPQLNHE